MLQCTFLASSIFVHSLESGQQEDLLDKKKAWRKREREGNRNREKEMNETNFVKRKEGRATGRSFPLLTCSPLLSAQVKESRLKQVLQVSVKNPSSSTIIIMTTTTGRHLLRTRRRRTRSLAGEGEEAGAPSLGFLLVHEFVLLHHLLLLLVLSSLAFDFLFLGWRCQVFTCTSFHSHPSLILLSVFYSTLKTVVPVDTVSKWLALTSDFSWVVILVTLHFLSVIIFFFFMTGHSSNDR